MGSVRTICASVALVGIIVANVVVSARAETIRYRYDAKQRLVQARAFQNGTAWDYRFDLADNRAVQTLSTASACADRTVCNGSFEQQFSFWDGTDNATLVSGRTGQAALVAKDAANSDIQQLLPGMFEAGKTYRATAWCKANTGNTCRLFLGDSNNIFGAEYENSVKQEWGGNGAWQKISTPPLTLTHHELLNVYLYSDLVSAVAYDDVQVEEVAPYFCANFTVCNGNLERGFEYWSSLRNAQLTVGRTGSGVHIDPDTNNSDIIQTIPGTFPAGVTYRATAWCKASAGNTCQLFFGDSNVANGPAYEHAGRHRLTANGTWQQLSVTITVTHPEQMQIYLYGGTDIVYDDVQVTQMTPATSFAKSLQVASKQDVAPEMIPAVPEPGTLLLLAGGLICLLALRRR